jgi:hypothetical protein
MNRRIKGKYRHINRRITGKYRHINRRMRGKYRHINRRIIGKYRHVNRRITRKYRHINRRITGKYQRILSYKSRSYSTCIFSREFGQLCDQMQFLYCTAAPSKPLNLESTKHKAVLSAHVVVSCGQFECHT